MSSGLRVATVMVAVSGLATVATADLLYSQAPHVPGAAGANGLSAFQGVLPPGTAVYDREIGDDFTVTAATGWRISRVTASAVQFDPNDPNVVTGAEIKFFQLGGGVVGSLVATATVNNITRANGPGTYFTRPERIMGFDISPVDLPAGNYFVQIQFIVDHNWFWLTSSPSTPIAGSPAQIQRGVLTDPANDATWPVAWQPTGPGSAIFPTASDQAFRLDGTVITSTTCYANCDGSTVIPILNVSDFICFQTKYAANDPTANCDGSTVIPVLNVSDFICFQTKYSAGCS
jgi:hypothetical protein